MISRLWPKTRGAWVFVIAFAVVFLVLDVLALLGVELAVGLLVTLAGFVVGVLPALAITYLLVRRVSQQSPWRFLWFAFGIASTFGILVGGSALAGIPLFPTAEGGYVGAFIYGAALGFGISVCNFSLGEDVRTSLTGALGDRQSRGLWTKTSLLVGGVIAGFLALCVLGYLAVEYVLSPIVRSLA
jgi:hypothetical protein